MKSEAEAIEDVDLALEFAFGCILASIKERIMSMNFAVTSVRWTAVAVMLVLGLFGALGVWRITPFDPASAIIFGLSTSAFVTAALWSLIRGPMALVQAASTMLLAYAVALAVISTSAAGSWLNADLHRNLAWEGLVIWGLLLASGIFVTRYSARSVSDRA